MWVDENADADPTGSATGEDDLTVPVTGQEYSADITMDIDSDGDGDADSYRAAYGEASGDWVATQPGGGGMSADMPAGDMPLGPPTVDTNDDGVADTAVAEDDAGNTLMFTDVDGDGAADIVVVVTPDGESTTYEHTGDGEWTPVGDEGAARSSLLGAPVDDTATVGVKGWGGADSTNVFGVAHINPATGQWISPN